MATIVNNPGPDRVIERTDSGGWVIAIIILLAVIAGLFWWFRYYRAPAPAPAANDTANLEVTIPTPTIQEGGASERAN